VIKFNILPSSGFKLKFLNCFCPVKKANFLSYSIRKVRLVREFSILNKICLENLPQSSNCNSVTNPKPSIFNPWDKRILTSSKLPENWNKKVVFPRISWDKLLSQPPEFCVHPNLIQKIFRTSSKYPLLSWSSVTFMGKFLFNAANFTIFCTSSTSSEKLKKPLTFSWVTTLTEASSAYKS
jgi:hypothetical protein